MDNNPLLVRRRNRANVRRAVRILEMEDPTFKKNFRMSKTVFERLVQVVAPRLRATNRVTRERTDMREAILMGLWIFFNPDTFRSEGVNFDVSTNVIHRHYKNLSATLCDVGGRYIKWPSRLERQRTSLFYERTCGFPGIVLSVDSTLIQITAPAEQKQRYVDRHHNYSINVQLACDHRRLIRDLYAGEPGSVNDSRVFKRSPLGHNLYGRDDLLTADQHLIGDGAYSNTSKLLTPYRDYGNLQVTHRNYNYMLSMCRSTVERVNGLLKSRFSRLRRLFCKDIRTTVEHIAASAVLYNFVLLDGEESDGVYIACDPPNIDVAAAINALEEAGFQKRRFIRILLDDDDAEDD